MNLDPIALDELRAIENSGHVGRDFDRARALMNGTAQSVSDVAALVDRFASSPSHDIVMALIHTIRNNSANTTDSNSFQFLLTVAGEYRREWNGSMVETLLGFVVEFWDLKAAETYPLEKIKPLIDIFIERTGLNVSALDLIEDVLLGSAIEAPWVLPRFVSEMARTEIIERIQNPSASVWRDFIREHNPSDVEKERLVLQALLALQT